MGKGREKTGKLISMEEKLDRREEVELELEWLWQLGDKIWAEEARLNAVNEVKVQQIKLAEKILNRIIIGDGVRIEKKLFEPWPSMGSVSIAGETFEIDDMEELSKVIRMASNMEICLKTDQTVEMELAFHGLMYMR